MSDERKDLPPPTAPNFLARVRETLMVYLGSQGNLLDRGLTLRDLQAVGMIDLSKTYLAGQRSVQPVVGTGAKVEDAYEKDLTPPPTPTGFAVSAAISNILLQHDAPGYTQGHGHARTRVYGATWVSGALPTFASATEITQFTGTFFAHATNPSTTWHLWIKWESVDGVLSVTPAGGTNGLVTTTGQDVATLLTALSSKITETQLYTTLGSRINLIDGADTLAGSVNARILTETQARTTAITTEQTVRADADTSLAANINTVSAVANAKNRSYRQAAAPVGTFVTGDLWFDSDDSNKPYRWDGAAWVATDDARIAVNAAAIVTEQTARANGDSANAASITTLTTTVNGNTTAIQTETSTRTTQTGELYAQNTVKIDLAGLISGYGLASTATTAAPTAIFGVRANAFFVAPPATASATAPTVDLYDGYVWLDTSVAPNVTRYRSAALWVTTPPVLPFVVQATPTTVNGVAVPAGVYMLDAFVKNGTITNLKVANAAIDDAKVANLSASKLIAGSIAVGQYIQSTGYVAGSAGWRINGDGTAEFSGVVVRGTIYATAGQIGGNTIDTTGMQSATYTAGSAGWRLASNGTGQIGGLTVGTNYIQSNNYVAGSAGWKLDNDGTLEASSGTFRGALGAATGTFAGSLSAASGTFAGTLTAAAINAVNTINIAGNAVTVPASAFTAAAISVGTADTYVTVQSINFTTTGQQLFVHASCFLNFDFQGANGSSGDIYAKLLRAGVLIFEGRIAKPSGTYPDSDYLSWSQGIGDTPAAGTYLYEMQIKKTDALNTVNATNRSLFILETKR